MKANTDPWIVEFFETIDRMDADGFAGYFSENGEFRFANHPPLKGKGAVREGAQGIFGMLTRIDHELVNTWHAGENILVEGVVHYHRSEDGLHLAFPFFSVFDFEDRIRSQVQSYRVFVDSHELFLPAGD
jgi:ketosteroid isomerase-like protein